MTRSNPRKFSGKFPQRKVRPGNFHFRRTLSSAQKQYHVKSYQLTLNHVKSRPLFTSPEDPNCTVTWESLHFHHSFSYRMFLLSYGSNLENPARPEKYFAECHHTYNECATEALVEQSGSACFSERMFYLFEVSFPAPSTKNKEEVVRHVFTHS